jgi:long-chain-fatty-acyl-CoA reductase
MTKYIDLPIVVCGETKYPSGDPIRLQYENDVEVRITRPTEDDLEQIFRYHEPLETIPVAKVSRYLSTFAQSFANPEHPLRKEAVSLSSYITGYNEKMLDRDYGIITAFLSARFSSYDLVASELGDGEIMDSWIRRGVARVRAFPRGRALHVLVGNVPLTGIYSVFRSVLTKNQTVAKLPARDIVSTLYFIRGLIDANNDGTPYRSMLNSSLSALYLDSKSAELKRLIESSDVVCAWGKGSSLKSIKEKVPYATPYLEFGPKRSFALVYPNDCDLDEAAVRLAHDASLYDQEACVCPQRVFVMGPYEEFIKKLARWLEWQSHALPRGLSNPDVESHIVRMELEARFRQWEMVSGDPAWRIIVCDPYEVGDHPLGRTMFVHPIHSEEEILPFIDEETQAISVYPYDDRVERLGDLFCAAGVSKLCETGMVMYPREGWTHDGMYPLNYFVRLCYLDQNMAWEYKYQDRDGAIAFLDNMYGKPVEDYDKFLHLFPVDDF